LPEHNEEQLRHKSFLKASEHFKSSRTLKTDRTAELSKSPPRVEDFLKELGHPILAPREPKSVQTDLYKYARLKQDAKAK